MKYLKKINYSALIVFVSTLFIIGCASKPIPKTEHVPSYYETQIITWLKSMQKPNGLIETSNGSNLVSLYDNALAAMAFMLYNEQESAEKVFDFFYNQMDSEFNTGKHGFGQFRDSIGNSLQHAWMGDNAWLLIAIRNYEYSSGNSKYNDMANAISDWLIELQTPIGGLNDGYHNDVLIKHQTTEGNIDAFNAINGYTDFHKNLLQWLKEYRWDSQDGNLITEPDATEFRYALDLHSWAFCIFEEFPVNSLYAAERFLCTKYHKYNDTTIQGYCFDEDKDVVWLEGTGEMAVAFNEAQLYNQAEFYINELEKLFIESTIFENAGGLPYGSNNGTGYGPYKLWIGVDTNIAVASSVWYLFAKSQFNPFAINKSKNIPIEDRFYFEDK